MNHCLFKAKDTKGAVGNTVDYSSLTNYDLITALSNLAKEKKLDYAIDVYPHYSSDVETTLRAGYDIRHGLIGPGVYASHNYERSHMDGVHNTFELLKAYITR